MPTEWQQVIYLSLAYVHKRRGSIEQATKIWRHLLSQEFPFNLYVHEELAKYYEHREKDYPQALRITDKASECLNMNSPFTSGFNYQRALESLKYRRERLKRKIKKEESEN